MSKFDRTRRALNGASAGLAVAVAFFNVALLVVKLVQTVTEETSLLEDDTPLLENEGSSGEKLLPENEEISKETSNIT
ncbi:MAG: hypothetical protein IKE52_02925 [Mogibacterium sp.]|nr:hypothetical protein [Mogibacterium sp.]